jgi:hypothetical protein
MKYMDCPLKYIGKRGWTFHTRYKEDIQAIRNNSKLEYSNHILSSGHIKREYNWYNENYEIREKGKTS